MPRQKLPKAYSTKITPRKTPAVVFEKIFKWITKDVPEERWTRMQNILTYTSSEDYRTLEMNATDNYVYVVIRLNGNCKFYGFVLSLDEFKLIWNRIL